MRIHYLKSILLAPFFVAWITSVGQDILFTTDGRKLDFQSYQISDDGTLIHVRGCLTCLNSLPVDSVAELVYFTEERVYHLKRIFNPSLDVAFMELVTSGKINLYKRVLQVREKGHGIFPRRPLGRYTQETQYFLEKDGLLKQILPAYAANELVNGLRLKEFVGDDLESAREINNVKFELTPASVLQVVENYNSRVFEQLPTGETDGLASFMLVRDHQGRTPLTAEVNGKPTPLTDVLTLNIPVSVDTKVCIANGDGANVKCQVVRGTRHFPLFFEVLVDKGGRDIEFRKVHSKKFSHATRRVANARPH